MLPASHVELPSFLGSKVVLFNLGSYVPRHWCRVDSVDLPAIPWCSRHVPTVGLLFLDDLHSFGSWISDLAPAWATERLLDGPLLPPTIQPPPIVIVVARTLTWNLLETSAYWLRVAEYTIVVLDRTGIPLIDEPEHAELLALECAELSKKFDSRVTFLETTSTDLQNTIDEAFRLARETPTLSSWDTLPNREAWPAQHPGPWIDWAIAMPERFSTSLDIADVLRLLAPAICRPGGKLAVLDGMAGFRIDLETGHRESIAGLAGTSHLWRPIAAMPDGESWFVATERGAFKLEGAHSSVTSPGGWGWPMGIDPTAKLAWAGGRCYFHFRVLTEQGAVYWTPSSHDWPCGHGKKLYGYKDNDPLCVSLSADASVCLSVYEHDTLLTPGLPLRWRDLGGFALAERVRGEPRVLLFWRADGDDGFPGDPYEADEDARDGFVVATIGPSPKLRYTVSLEKPTYRLADGHVVRLGGPEAGWIVCNDRHEIVHRAAGRLLGGWGSWVVIEIDGAVFRENIESGERHAITAIDRPIAAAVSIAGSPNVVLVNLENGRPAIRLV